MATLRHDHRTGNWQIRFYWCGEQQERSCRTKTRSKALRIKATVEETLELVKSGRIAIPDDVESVEWIMSGGKQLAPLRRGVQIRDQKFGAICDAYFHAQKHKHETTLSGESIHIRHLKKQLRTSTSIQKIDLETLGKYHRNRARQKHNGKPISDATIRKELATFRQIWIWAKQNGHVTGVCPLLDDNGRWRIRLEKPNSRDKFQTWDQIERRIQRKGLSESEASKLWEGLFLDYSQVCDLVEHARTRARHSFILPMFAFAAYTGARRSEIVRSEIDDFDFDLGQIIIRERKRRKDRQGSTRLVPLHPKLREIMSRWFEEHPGGCFTIAPPKCMRGRMKSAVGRDHLTGDQAHHHFETTLNKTKWQVIRGFHVLRHSFGSNLVRTGKVPSDVVGKWMGHSSEEMRELYQHLFPQDGLNQIGALE